MSAGGYGWMGRIFRNSAQDLAGRSEGDGFQTGSGGIALDEGDAAFVVAGFGEADDADAIGFVNVSGGLLVLDFHAFRGVDGPDRAAFAFYR